MTALRSLAPIAQAACRSQARPAPLWAGPDRSATIVLSAAGRSEAGWSRNRGGGAWSGESPPASAETDQRLAPIRKASPQQIVRLQVSELDELAAPPRSAAVAVPGGQYPLLSRPAPGAIFQHDPLEACSATQDSIVVGRARRRSSSMPTTSPPLGLRQHPSVGGIVRRPQPCWRWFPARALTRASRPRRCCATGSPWTTSECVRAEHNRTQPVTPSMPSSRRRSPSSARSRSLDEAQAGKFYEYREAPAVLWRPGRLHHLGPIVLVQVLEAAGREKYRDMINRATDPAKADRTIRELYGRHRTQLRAAAGQLGQRRSRDQPELQTGTVVGQKIEERPHDHCRSRGRWPPITADEPLRCPGGRRCAWPNAAQAGHARLDPRDAQPPCVGDQVWMATAGTPAPKIESDSQSVDAVPTGPTSSSASPSTRSSSASADRLDDWLTATWAWLSGAFQHVDEAGAAGRHFFNHQTHHPTVRACSRSSSTSPNDPDRIHAADHPHQCSTISDRGHRAFARAGTLFIHPQA